MGNSATTLQSVVDYAKTIGDINPVLSAGGYNLQPAVTIANDVMTELLAQPFNWKFNRIVVPVFYTNSWQQDYASVNVTNIGWLEHAAIIDINNTQLPKPIYWLECVRDLEITSYSFGGRPQKICWLPNDQIVQNAWPGAQKTYTNPIGATQQPANPFTNIVDANGNILILTTFGTTGNSAPVAAVNAPSGTTVNDGTCVWTVANPKGQGFRISPVQPQTGVVWQVNVFAQAKAPKFTSLSQMLDPLPDDYAKHFREGFIAYCHRHSPAPPVRARFKEMREAWLQSIMQARMQGDRERDDAGFVPATSIMSEGATMPVGPAWPYGPFGIG